MYVLHFPITKLLGARLLGGAATTHSATIAVLYAAAVTSGDVSVRMAVVSSV